MKKITVALAAFVALSSTVAFADSPAVREMNTFESVLKKASVKTAAGQKSEFVIYHQDNAKPCAGKHGKGKHAAKKAIKKHVKKAAKPASTSAEPASSEAK